MVQEISKENRAKYGQNMACHGLFNCGCWASMPFSQLAIMHVNLSVSKILPCLQPYKSPKWLLSGKEPTKCLSVVPVHLSFFFLPRGMGIYQTSLVLVHDDESWIPSVKRISSVPLHFSSRSSNEEFTASATTKEVVELSPCQPHILVSYMKSHPW